MKCPFSFLLISLSLTSVASADVGVRLGAGLGNKQPDFWAHDTMVATTPKHRHFFDIDLGRYRSKSQSNKSLDIDTGVEKVTYRMEHKSFDFDYRFLMKNNWYISTSPKVTYHAEDKEPSVYENKKNKTDLTNSVSLNFDILSTLRVGRLFSAAGWQGNS